MPKCPKDCKKSSCIFFKRTTIPPSVADDSVAPPQNGDFCNMLVVYEATGNAYLFASDGIPNLLSTTDYNKLRNLPSINGVTVIGKMTLKDIGVVDLVGEEADRRRRSDDNLQEQIDAIVASSDVVDIVGTHEELEEYDTSGLTINDVIKVLADETEGGATTYYRWSGSEWEYIGSEGPYYTTSQVDALLDDKLDVNALNDYYDQAQVNALLADKADVAALADKQDKLVAGSNITIDQATNVISATMPSLDNYYTKSETYSQNEVDGLISGVTAQIPTNTSDLYNDSGFLTSIPIASSSDLGGIKVGSGLSIDGSGVLSMVGITVTVDSALSTTSTNPVENRVITNALNGKANTSDIPTIPANVSAFYNDVGYLTSTDVASNYYNKSETYNQTEVDGLISGVSSRIPTKTSDLTNDGSDNTSTYVELDELATVATSGSYNDLTNKPSIMSGLVEMSYGESNAWAKFIAAYQAKQIVYCRASSQSNPATGTQGRKAFMAYVNNADNPTEVEFQYVRSVSSKTSSQPVDQVFVYKLTNANGGTWTVETRNMAPKLAQGTNTTVSYSNGTYTISATQPTVNNATLTVQHNGDSQGTFTANASSNSTINIKAPVRVDLSADAQTNSYRRTVIGLCEVSTTDNDTKDSFSSGRISMHRYNGLAGGIEININIENQYRYAYYTNVSWYSNLKLLSPIENIDTAKGFRPCTFKHNNIWYGGIEVFVNNANLDHVVFEGDTNFDIFALDYYQVSHDSSAAVILDQEVYDSLNYTQWTPAMSTEFFDSIDLKTGVITKNDTYTATLPDKNGTIAMTSDMPAVNDATLTIQKNGTTVNTFTANASSNVTANITVPTKTSDITNDGSDGNSAYSEVFVINVTSCDLVNNTFTADKTFDQIKAALDAGKTLILKVTIDDINYVVPFDNFYSGDFESNYEYNISFTYSVAQSYRGTVTGLRNYGLFFIFTRYGTVGNYSYDNWCSEGIGAVSVTNSLASRPVDADVIPNAQSVYDALGTKASSSSIPTKTSDLTNDGSDNTSTYTEADDMQKMVSNNSTVAPNFDGMTPLQTFTWSVSDTTYRPIYQMENTGWTYDSMDVEVAYRITTTGTGINQIVDIVDRWFSPNSYPVTSALARSLSTTAATTGFRYLRAVYPTSSYVNNNTYKIGQEVSAYNSTARTIKVEVFKTDSHVTWNTSKPAGSIYAGNSTYQATASMTIYTSRGWLLRQPALFAATSAGSASYVSSYEPALIGSSVIKSGATALAAGHLAYLADDGVVYDISNTAKNIAVGESKIGLISSAVSANAAISSTYWRPLVNLSSTQVGYIPHATLALGNRVYLRCTMDASGHIHSDNYLATSMSAGYTWLPFGVATASNTIYMDVRNPIFYTLDASGKLTYIDGKELAGGGTTYTAGTGIDITNGVISLDLANANNINY